MHEKSCFTTLFSSQRVSRSQTLLKAPPEQFYPNFSSFSNKSSQKTSLLVRSQILGLFFNTLTADNKDSRRNTEDIPQPIQMLLSKKQKTFYQYLIVFFLECR